MDEPQKFRKKPVAIEAMEWTGLNLEAVSVFVGDSLCQGQGQCQLGIMTLEGLMSVSLGDYIIKGVKGEFYPCKPDIFAATYWRDDMTIDVQHRGISIVTESDLTDLIDKYVAALAERDKAKNEANQLRLAFVLSDTVLPAEFEPELPLTKRLHVFIERLQAESYALKEQLIEWLKCNGTGGWIDNLRIERDKALEVIREYRFVETRQNHRFCRKWEGRSNPSDDRCPTCIKADALILPISIRS